MYLDKLSELLHSNDKFATRHQAIAIAGVTGRRLNEVLARGQFSLSEHPYLLRFEGHSKVQRDAYNIVTLIEAARLLPILEQFRQRPEIQPLLTKTGDELAAAINQFDVQVNRECNKYLADIVPPLEGREAISVHNLRSLWGAIAAYEFCPPSSHEYPFLQHYLGHAIDSAATGHYFRYRLIDESGNYLSERGVKIAQCGELPLPHSQQASAVKVNETPSIPEADHIPETVAETAFVPEIVSADHLPKTVAETGSVAVAMNEIETIDEPLPLKNAAIDTPSLSLRTSLADHPLAQSLLAPASQLLHSERYTHQLTGLMAVTGLQASELLKSKKFYPYPDDPFALLLCSTIATSKERLVTLVDAAAVLEAITRLKAHPDVQSLLYLSPNEIDSRCLSHVAKTLSSHLPFKNVGQMLAAYQSLVGTNQPTDEDSEPKRPTTTIYNIYTDDRQRLDAIAHSKSFSGSQANIFHSLLDWVEKQLKKEATPVEAQQNESILALTEQAKTLTWLTNEITSLREQVATLELERDDLKSQLAQKSTPAPQIDILQTENERLSDELDKANSTLSMFRQLLNGDTDEINEPPPEGSEPHRQNVKTEPPSAIISETPKPSPVELPQNPDKKRRRPRSDGGARARASAIWNALQQWNHQHPEQTFALNAALLEVTFHINRQAAHDFIDEYKAQIDAHHTAIGVKTVRTHNRGKDITPLKASVEQQRFTD